MLLYLSIASLIGATISEIIRIIFGCQQYGIFGSIVRALAFGLPAAYLWFDSTMIVIVGVILLISFIWDYSDAKKNNDGS